MSEMNDIIKTSLEGIKTFANVDTVIGNPINTPNGVTIIPVSKVTVGFVGGGVDYSSKKVSANQNFGSGSGTGVSVTPRASLARVFPVQGQMISISSFSLGPSGSASSIVLITCLPQIASIFSIYSFVSNR